MYISLFVKKICMIDTKYYVKQQLINDRLRSFHFEPINIHFYRFLHQISKQQKKKNPMNWANFGNIAICNKIKNNKTKKKIGNEN